MIDREHNRNVAKGRALAAFEPYLASMGGARYVWGNLSSEQLNDLMADLMCDLMHLHGSDLSAQIADAQTNFANEA